jgi:hypothetical protein
VRDKVELAAAIQRVMKEKEAYPRGTGKKAGSKRGHGGENYLRRRSSFESP